jgi:quercetin dioxygenase-like cupin family protein
VIEFPQRSIIAKIISEKIKTYVLGRKNLEIYLAMVRPLYQPLRGAECVDISLQLCSAHAAQTNLKLSKAELTKVSFLHLSTSVRKLKRVARGRIPVNTSLRKNIMKIKSVFFSLLSLLLATSVFAQAPEIKRTPLQTVQLSTPGKVAIQMIVEVAPGGTIPRHTHPGEEIAYIMSGELVLLVDGKESKVVKTGESFSVPEGSIHGGKNASTAAATLLVTYVVDKDKPVATPAKN